jgi:hypothetical protein
MNPYVEVDSVIDAWVKATGATLFTEWADRPSRYVHIPGDPPFECFQIVVFPPRDDRIVVQVAAIDTNDDTELEMLQTSEGSVGELEAMLATAIATIETWKRRRHDRGP